MTRSGRFGPGPNYSNVPNGNKRRSKSIKNALGRIKFAEYLNDLADIERRMLTHYKRNKNAR